VADQVRRIAAPKEALVTQAGCTVSSHCGPNTTGILYMVKEAGRVGESPC